MDLSCAANFLETGNDYLSGFENADEGALPAGLVDGIRQSERIWAFEVEVVSSTEDSFAGLPIWPI